MTQLLGIAKNTLLQTIRQPIYGIVVLVTLGGIGLAPAVTGWTLDDDNKLLRDIGLSTLLIQGLFLAVFGASAVLSAEIDDKTVLTVAAKPVGRSTFVLGKYLGVLGALALAHYLAGVAFYMAMRHGVLQSAADEPDFTVIVFGPGIMLLATIAAIALNYFLEWRFLPTVVAFAAVGLTLGTIVLLNINREWRIARFESTQSIERLPRQCEDGAVFGGVVFFRPDAGQLHLAGHRGELVHNDWKGPITDEQHGFLRAIVDSPQWRQWVDFLVEKTRKRQGVEVAKAALLVFVAVALLGAIALAASTRLGLMATFLTSAFFLCAGLMGDQLLREPAESGHVVARIVYYALPNFQVFWMIDALSELLVIPWSYVGAATAYGLTYTLAAILLAMGLFQTREVG